MARAEDTYVEPGSRAGRTVAEHRDEQRLQAVEELFALGARAQLHAQQAQHGCGQGLLLALACGKACGQSRQRGPAPSLFRAAPCTLGPNLS